MDLTPAFPGRTGTDGDGDGSEAHPRIEFPTTTAAPTANLTPPTPTPYTLQPQYHYISSLHRPPPQHLHYNHYSNNATLALAGTATPMAIAQGRYHPTGVIGNPTSASTGNAGLLPSAIAHRQTTSSDTIATTKGLSKNAKDRIVSDFKNRKGRIFEVNPDVSIHEYAVISGINPSYFRDLLYPKQIKARQQRLQKKRKQERNTNVHAVVKQRKTAKSVPQTPASNIKESFIEKNRKGGIKSLSSDEYNRILQQVCNWDLETYLTELKIYMCDNDIKASTARDEGRHKYIESIFNYVSLAVGRDYPDWPEQSKIVQKDFNTSDLIDIILKRYPNIRIHQLNLDFIYTPNGYQWGGGRCIYKDTLVKLHGILNNKEHNGFPCGACFQINEWVLKAIATYSEVLLQLYGLELLTAEEATRKSVWVNATYSLHTHDSEDIRYLLGFEKTWIDDCGVDQQLGVFLDFISVVYPEEYKKCKGKRQQTNLAKAKLAGKKFVFLSPKPIIPPVTYAIKTIGEHIEYFEWQYPSQLRMK